MMLTQTHRNAPIAGLHRMNGTEPKKIAKRRRSLTLAEHHGAQ
jgi:hypothetical protein